MSRGAPTPAAAVAILRPVRLHPALIPETIAPSRLGRSFRWLLASSIVTNVGDGIALAAGPLLVAAQTRDPLLVSMALLSQQLPPRVPISIGLRPYGE